MSDSVFIEMEFFSLILISVVAPASIYAYMLYTRSISRLAVLALGATLVTISGVSVFLLQVLNEMSVHTPSQLDDRWFHTEISVALYLLPALFAGVGINLISHVLIGRLEASERRYDDKHGATLK